MALAALLALCAACTTDHTRRGYLRTMAESLDTPPRPVIIVPGFGVTRLYDPVTRRYVWGTGRNTMVRRYPDDLDLPASGHDRLVPRGYVGSRGPVNIGWQLTEGLRKFGRYVPGRDVYPFHYDWRLPAAENAARLAALVAQVRREHDGLRVDIVSHSAGWVVAATYLKLQGGGASVDHLVGIAPVQHGAVDAFRVLVRPERFLRRSFSEEMVATWPAVAELLPARGDFLIDESGRTLPFDAWDADSWRAVLHDVPPSFRRSLAAARQFRQTLDGTPMPDGLKVTVLAGDCVATARRALRRADGTYAFYPSELTGRERQLAATMFEPGDGTVPVSSSHGSGETLYFCDGHQGIAADPNVQHALIKLLRDDDR